MDASGYSYELLVIDDRSTDDTLEVLPRLRRDFPQMRYAVPPQRRVGDRPADRDRRRPADEIVVWTDADMTYPNERIPEFVRYLDDHPEVDQVVGARTDRGGHPQVGCGCRRSG